ncbi:MAG: hypothetical protein MJ237_08895 [bacterium]|nr:hypothetical protein [bacterium]
MAQFGTILNNMFMNTGCNSFNFGSFNNMCGSMGFNSMGSIFGSGFGMNNCYGLGTGFDYSNYNGKSGTYTSSISEYYTSQGIFSACMTAVGLGAYALKNRIDQKTTAKQEQPTIQSINAEINSIGKEFGWDSGISSTDGLKSKKEIALDDANSNLNKLDVIKPDYEYYNDNIGRIPGLEAEVTDLNSLLEQLETGYNANSGEFPAGGVIIKGEAYMSLDAIKTKISEITEEIANKQKEINDIKSKKANHDKYAAALEKLDNAQKAVEAEESARETAKDKIAKLIEVRDELQRQENNQATAESIDDNDGNVISRMFGSKEESEAMHAAVKYRRALKRGAAAETLESLKKDFIGKYNVIDESDRSKELEAIYIAINKNTQ